uniref:Uncharacterized protein n=1 Tax=Myoviridae sp. ctNQV2 TaxID=2827683 RepID=A0A8S5RZT4_9CAUD|nr:MAG TPA: hypothetical protein [Myoviridae sp. ctNQV2]
MFLLILINLSQFLSNKAPFSLILINSNFILVNLS